MFTFTKKVQAERKRHVAKVCELQGIINAQTRQMDTERRLRPTEAQYNNRITEQAEELGRQRQRIRALESSVGSVAIQRQAFAAQLVLRGHCPRQALDDALAVYPEVSV